MGDPTGICTKRDPRPRRAARHAIIPALLRNLNGPFTVTQVIDLPAQNDIRRILIMRWSALGDVVISTTAIEDVRRAFPNALIDLNTMPAYTALFDHDDRLNDVFAIDLRKTERGLKGVWRWLKRVRQGRYDLLVDLQSNDRARFLVSLLRLTGPHPRWRIGCHNQFPYNIAASKDISPTAHVFDRTRSALSNAGIPQSANQPVLGLSPDNESNCARLLAENHLTDRPYAVFFPGCQAAGFLKRWGAERYAALAGELVQQGLDKVLLVGGPDEADELDKIAELAGPAVINLCGQTRLLDIVPLVQSARFVVSNDTGPGHIAAAADRPITVICGPTDPARVKPVGSQVTTLQAEQDCLNCYCRKECDDHSCMVAITPAQVVQQIVPHLP